jgi:phage gp36-like protein
MPYILVTDLLTRFGAEELAQLADRDTPRLVTDELLSAAAAGTDMTGWSDADVDAVSKAVASIEQAIEDAQSAIDGYLSGRYGTPIATPPAVVKRLACDIARYYLYDDHATETVQKRYDAAIAFFRDVSAGKVTLGAETQATQPAGGIVEIVTSDRVFSRSGRGL